MKPCGYLLTGFSGTRCSVGLTFGLCVGVPVVRGSTCALSADVGGAKSEGGVGGPLGARVGGGLLERYLI